MGLYLMIVDYPGKYMIGYGKYGLVIKGDFGVIYFLIARGHILRAERFPENCLAVLQADFCEFSVPGTISAYRTCKQFLIHICF